MVLQSVIGTHRRQQTETVELRHHDVGQHERGRARARGAQRRFAVVDRLHAIAGRDQQPFDVLPHVAIVVRQQHEVMTAVMRDRMPADILRARGREAIRCVPPPVEPGRSFLQIGLGANRGRERLRVAVDACARQVLGTEWQRDGEPAALALFAVDGDPAAVQPDQLLHQREPDAAAFDAAAAGAFDAMKAFEQPRQLLRRNAGAGVAHRDLGGAAVRTGPHLDRDFTLEGELERIGEKIEHDLLPHVAVDIDGFGQRGTVEAKPQAGPLHRRLERRSDIRRQPCKIHRLEAGLRPPQFDAGEIEQRVHQLEQPHAVAMRDRHQRLVLRKHGAFRLGQYFLERAEHQRQRRAKLMAHVGEERGLGAIDFRQRFGAAALLLVGFGVGDGGGDLARDRDS